MKNEQDQIVSAIFDFSGDMEERLLNRDLIYKNFNEESSLDLLRNIVQLSTIEINFIDVANLAMMLHRFQKETNNETVH